MSSNENVPQGSYHGQAWSQNVSGDDSSLRRPTSTTESRVLSRLPHLNKSVNEQAQQSQSGHSQAGGSGNASASQHRSQQPLTLPEVPSGLSADAKEFVPRAQVAYQPDSYSQYNPSSGMGSLSVSAAEFVPQGPEEYSSYDRYEADPTYLTNSFTHMSLQDSSYDQSYDYGPESSGDPILYRYNKALAVLNMHPGNMEEYLKPICEMIQGNPGSTEMINCYIVESLFEQSIQEPNFRYTGARICQFLSTNLKGNPYFDGFHKTFLSRCQKEYNKRESLINGCPEDQERLRGLAMFMAEIYLNVETEAEDGTTQRIQFLPKILIDFVQTLLSSPTDLNVKCSCQLLKLSGALIEDVVKNTPDDCVKFEDIFTQLSSLQNSKDLTENAKFLAGSVIKLKEADWNRNNSSPPKKSLFSFATDPNNFQAPEPVFYNNLGAPCSRREAGIPEEDGEDGAYVLNDEEEQAFLEWQAEQESLTGDPGAWTFNDTGYESYQLDDAGDDGGMGDEVEAAYEEFLQENFIQGYQQQQPQQQRQPQMAAPPPHQQHQIPPVMQQMYQNMPPPVAYPPPNPDFYGYPPPQHGLPQNQMQQQQQHHQNQQQQQQHPPQPPYYNNDRYHYNR